MSLGGASRLALSKRGAAIWKRHASSHDVSRCSSSSYLDQGGRVQSTTQWLVGDYNGDGFPDLWGIATPGTRSGMTPLHVLDGATDDQTFIAHIETAHRANGLTGYNFYLPAP